MIPQIHAAHDFFSHRRMTALLRNAARSRDESRNRSRKPIASEEYSLCLVDVREVLRTGAWVAGGIAVYEIVRSSIVFRVRRRIGRSSDRYVAARGVQLDRYKFAGREYVKTEVLLDPELNRAMAAAVAE